MTQSSLLFPILVIVSKTASVSRSFFTLYKDLVQQFLTSKNMVMYQIENFLLTARALFVTQLLESLLLRKNAFMDHFSDVRSL